MRFMFHIVMILIAGALANAQARTYTLDEILNLAAENNKEIKLAKSDLKYASAQMKEAVSNALPQINLNLGYNRNLLENRFFFTVTDSNGQEMTQSFKASFRNEYLVNAQLNQNIYSFGRTINAIKGASYFRKLTDFNYEGNIQRILTQVKSTFYQALLMQKFHEVAQASENSAKANYENLRAKFENGVISEYDLLQAEVRWQNAIPETIRALNNYKLVLNGLKALVNLPIGEELTLKGELMADLVLPREIEIEEALNRRPDYNSLLWRKKLQERNVAFQFANHLPSLTGSVSYIFDARSDEFRLDNDNDNIIVGLNLSVPVFSGGYTSAQVQKAKVEVDRVTTQIQMQQDNIRIELDNILLRMEEAKNRVMATRKSVNTAQRAFDIAESRVENGLATQLELKDSRLLMDQAQLNYYSAIYDFMKARFDWEYANGIVM